MNNHPNYTTNILDWEKFRLTINGGRDFVESYLQKLSTREDDTDFELRKQISYCTAHAKAAIIEIKNSIYQRLIDITRSGGAKSYISAVAGHDGGVDFAGNTLTSFIGNSVLLDLLAIGKVGVFVDKFPNKGDLKADNIGNRPYLYTYPAEDICSWTTDLIGNFTSILLRSHEYTYDDFTLPVETVDTYKLFKLTSDGVACTVYNDKDEVVTTYTIGIKEIPFFVFELSNSLLIDVADYQIAATNLASSDLNFALKANYPFYTEQYNPGANLQDMLKIDPEGTSSDTLVQDQTVKVGVVHGRKYPKGSERPGFINPSTDPMRASMEKQESMKQEVRELVNLAITNIDPKRASAESKKQDQAPLEAGLSYIGLELEFGERRIGHFWSLYEDAEDPVVSYPQNYSLRTDVDRRLESTELLTLSPKIPSKTFQKSIARNVVDILYGTKLSSVDLDTIKQEIDSSEIVNIDPALIIADHEAGLVSDELASKLRGYPKGQIEQARKDHSDRAARIALAQSTANQGGITNMDARGVKDMGMKNAKEEKL